MRNSISRIRKRFLPEWRRLIQRDISWLLDHNLRRRESKRTWEKALSPVTRIQCWVSSLLSFYCPPSAPIWPISQRYPEGRLAPENGLMLLCRLPFSEAGKWAGRTGEAPGLLKPTQRRACFGMPPEHSTCHSISWEGCGELLASDNCY